MAKYLRYIIKNLEHIRIANGATSQMGQKNTMRYIPGSTIRGFVVNAYAVMDPELNAIKDVIFSNRIVFLNAYLTSDSHTLIPSPKGFYEDKTIVEDKKEIVNVVTNGNYSEGFKRAALGRYCYIIDDCIYYYGVRTGSDLRITINDEILGRNVFRNEYLEKDQYFEGYIRFSGDEKVDDLINKLFTVGNKFSLGNARSSGMGTCEIVLSECIDSIPYLGEGFSLQEEAYMMLVSDTVLRGENGELCGMNPKDPVFCRYLEELFGVTNLSIPFASTSTRRVMGYNRKWGTTVPSVLAYEAGSVFHLRFHGIIDKQHMEKACNEGIGIRKNEGFGRIIFLRDYENVHFKMPIRKPWNKSNPITKLDLSKSEKDTMKIVASGLYRNALNDAMDYYVTHHELNKNGISNSQLGSIESQLIRFQYNPEKAHEMLCNYFEHVTEKEKKQRVQQKRVSGLGIREQIMNIIEESLETTLFYYDKKWPFRENGKVMGIPVCEFFEKNEEERYKLKLLIRMIRYDHRKEEC